MIRRFIHTIRSLLAGVSQGAAPKFDAARLKKIGREFNDREESDNRVQQHRLWLLTREGAEDTNYLAEHYLRLTKSQRHLMPMELARTGLRQIVPFVNAALQNEDDGGSVLSGIWYAYMFGRAEDEFGAGIAPELLKHVAAGGTKVEEVIELLPLMDAELAAKLLLTDEQLCPQSPYVEVILTAFNDARLGIPRERVEHLLKAWQPIMKKADAPYRIRRGCLEAVRALAAHDPQEGVALATEMVEAMPRDSYLWAEVVLAAAGLTGLYDELCDHFDPPEKFTKLPESAKVYSAIKCFQLDSQNGGFSQALGNSTGDYLPWVKKGYALLGDTHGTSFLEWMCKPFGSEGPSPVEDVRLRQMESMEPSYWEQEDALRESWGKAHPNESSKTQWLLSLYAAKHAAELRPLLEAQK